MAPLDDADLNTIEREAKHWWSQLREAGHSAEVEQQFFLWLQASPVHAEAYLRVASSAPDGIPETETRTLPAYASSSVSDHGSLARRRLQRWPMAGVLASVVIGIGWLVARPTPSGPVSEDIHLAAPHGQLRQWQLTDGSTIELASESTATVRYSGAERLVQLESGHGYFRVAKGDRRRFRVVADGASVVATGTEFDVNLTRGRNVVALIEGHVVVYADALALSAPAEVDAAAARNLSAGEQVTVADGWVSRPSPADSRRVQAWRNGVIVANNIALAEVVEEFNLYADKPVHVEDPVLARLTISGVFHVQDPESFLAFLRSSVNAELRPTSTGWMLIPRRQRRENSGLSGDQ